MTNKFKKILLLGGDVVILYLSLYLTLLLRYLEQPGLGTWQSHVGPFSLSFVAWLLLFYIFDLYNLNLAVNNTKFFNKTIQAVFIAGLITVGFFYINQNINIAPKTNLIIYLLVFSILFLSWRHLFNWSLNAYLPKSSLAVIGYSEEVKELIEVLKDRPHLGFNVKVMLDNSAIADIEGGHDANDIRNLHNIISEQKIDTIILAVDPYASPQLREALLQCLKLKVNVVDLAAFYEQVTGRIPINSITQMWFLTNLSEGSKKKFDRLKRLYDFFLALSILVVSAPLWPFFALLIKMESPGPVFFWQERLGLHSQSFKLVKFRSMRQEGNDGRPTESKDRRVTRFGRFLRATRLDELPQVLNILIGDMSFIGPRPEQPRLVEQLEQEVPFYRERMLVKPGLTGWDQVSGEYHSPSREDTLKKLQYDLFYIKNRSLYLDSTIILKTIATVLMRRGV